MESNKFRGELLNLQSHLYNFAKHLTSNKDEADDLLQETFLQAFDNEEKFTDNRNIKGWALTIMHNLFISNYRRLARLQYNGLTEPITVDLLKAADHSATWEDPLDLKEMLSIIDSFHEDLRKPLSMFMEGYTYKEIADDMSMPIGTVKSRIYTARKSLQNKLREYR